MIDENVADIVRMVFDKFVNEEWSEYKIAKYLLNYHSYKWTPDLVRRMLEMQEYAGNTVNFKTEGISFKTKNHVKNSKRKLADFQEYTSCHYQSGRF